MADVSLDGFKNQMLNHGLIDKPSVAGLSPDDSLIAIYGPTASGKSELAMQVSEQIGGEIVNYDSVQLYKKFNIGSAKPDAADLDRVKHHLIDVVGANDEMDAAIYRGLSREVHQKLLATKTPAVFVGGTGLYLRAFLGLSLIHI